MADAVTLEQVLAHIHNWFTRETLSLSECEVVDGQLPASVAEAVPAGTWYRIQGSYLNDGLHLRGAEDEGLNDESFSGTLSVLAVPRALLAVVDEISDWVAANAEARSKAAASPYQSESFGGYTYSMRPDLTGGSSSSSGSGGLTGWQAAFKSDLNPYRRLP